MESRPQTSKEYFRTLQIIYYALIAGQVLFGLISVLLNQMTGFLSRTIELRNILLYITPVFIIGGYFGGRILFRKNMNTARNRAGLLEKMSDYRAAIVIRYALLEGPSMLSIIAYLLTGDLLFLGMAGLIIFIFITLKPSSDKAAADLDLGPEDEHSVNDPDAVISEIRPG